MKIYIDENLPKQLADGLNILEQPNGHGVEVLSIKDVFGQGCADEDWIPKVGKQKAIVISRDINLYKKPQQRRLYMECGVGLFLFKQSSKKGFTYWQIVEHIVKTWSDVKIYANKTKQPFTYCINVNGKIEDMGKS
jgi:PIN like domain